MTDSHGYVCQKNIRRRANPNWLLIQAPDDFIVPKSNRPKTHESPITSLNFIQSSSHEQPLNNEEDTNDCSPTKKRAPFCFVIPEHFDPIAHLHRRNDHRELLTNLNDLIDARTQSYTATFHRHKYFCERNQIHLQNSATFDLRIH